MKTSVAKSGTKVPGQTSTAKSDAPVEAPAAAAGAATAIDPRLLVREQGFGGYISEFGRKIRAGELGYIPVVGALVIIAIIFQSLNSAFLSAGNISDIAVAMVGTGTIAVGIVFVLLLGEIDLSVGSVSGVAGAMFAVLAVSHGMAEWLAFVLAIVSGVVMGSIHGFFFSKIGVPAFAVTLAGLLFWNGFMLKLLGDNGTINLDGDGFVGKLTGYYFSDVAAAYGLAVVGVVVFFLSSFFDSRRRERAGVPARPLAEIIVRTVALAIVAFLIAYLFNQNRGLPLAVLIFVVILLVTDVVLRRTSYGRKVFALGGSVEASRRAGINVALVRTSVFAISGGFAALGGIFIASKITAANQSAGAGDLLMNAIAAAVIGGTSLFGGRGRTWDALLGVLVITSIQYGLALEGVASPVQYMITGAVLLATVVIDAITRKTQKTAGRA
ncbi:putative ABC transporter transmembrane protein [Streptomyces sp. Tu6071]|uniref:Xylose transport system permease protein XylH n=1 Tax=Streptomyces evansiae TaxID=3075535 RepID=A0ABD5E1M4_9ACTN|nr:MULTISPECIES: ABC transporter permease [unclassified Streptomyces]EGJ74076.1 putative ABC transporter transmembrane protein [Streptomyces sp. Tu6071]MDT0414542.1 sugar ABC transporter permease [Streptomyces sp. DSM 41982]